MNSQSYASCMAKPAFFEVFVDVRLATVQSKPRLQYVHVRVVVQ